VLDLLARDGECSVARLCKRLGLARSELQRLLLVLSAPVDALGDGLDLVERHEAGDRAMVTLSARGRALFGLDR
jgi:hypothetical protein